MVREYWKKVKTLIPVSRNSRKRESGGERERSREKSKTEKRCAFKSEKELSSRRIEKVLSSDREAESERGTEEKIKFWELREKGQTDEEAQGKRLYIIWYFKTIFS